MLRERFLDSKPGRPCALSRARQSAPKRAYQSARRSAFRNAKQLFAAAHVRVCTCLGGTLSPRTLREQRRRSTVRAAAAAAVARCRCRCRRLHRKNTKESSRNRRARGASAPVGGRKFSYKRHGTRSRRVPFVSNSSNGETPGEECGQTRVILRREEIRRGEGGGGRLLGLSICRLI